MPDDPYRPNAPSRARGRRRYAPVALGLVLAAGGLAACLQAGPPPTPTVPPLAAELIFYNWPDYLPQTVLDAFTAEYGVTITYVPYETAEEAFQSILAGLTYDVAVVSHDDIPGLVAAGRLAELTHGAIPNVINVPVDFRELAFDPGDTHSVPYSWGTTGLLVRTDLVTTPVTRWADLWDLALPGQIAVRPEPSELISLALMSLGYPLNSENPAELEAALARLQALKPKLVFVRSDVAAVEVLLSGEAVILVAYSGDALYAQARSSSTAYILPQEGSMIWGDRFVIAADSSRRPTAEAFINFLLRPEIGGQIVNQNHYAVANEAARQFVDPALLDNPILFPATADIKQGEWYMPLSPAGQQLYADLWARFMAASP